MKKRNLKCIISVMMSLLLLCNVAISASAKVITSDDTASYYDLDSHGDDPVPGVFGPDDFENPLEWQAHLAFHPELQREIRTAVAPSKKVTATPTLRYKIQGLKSTAAIQKAYVGSTYVYVTQRNDDTTYLSRCVINEAAKTATYKDRMTLKGFGHGETLEWYEYGDEEHNEEKKAYFLIGCKANSAYKDVYWSMQIGRIQYVPDKTVNKQIESEYGNYTQVYRFANMDFANKTASNFGAVKRVAAALSTDRKSVVFRLENTDGNLQYSTYDLAKLNKILSDKERTDDKSRYVSFEGNAALKAACLGSFTQIDSARVYPNTSFQGMELSDKSSIYVSGGSKIETPQIAKMTGTENGVGYSCLTSIPRTKLGTTPEIEGLQIKGELLYFGVCDHNDKTIQYIYSLDKTVF